MVQRGKIAWVAVGVVVTVLAVLAARADLEAPEVERWQVAADVVVGLAFVAAGAASPGPSRARGLLVAVGVLWLMGSLAHATRLWHQSALAVSLVTFPTAQLRTWIQGAVAAAAIAIGLLQQSQLLSAALFALVSSVVLARRDARSARRFPVLASVVVSLVLLASWSVARMWPASFDPFVALSIYEAVLVVIATTFPFALRAVLARRSLLVDRFLSDGGFVGLEGLEAVLQDALGDPTVRVHRWRADSGEMGPAGSLFEESRPPRRWLPITRGDQRPAAVEFASPALDDQATVSAVESAVRLALSNLDLQDELDEQLAALEAARVRLLAAGDRQREATAARLRHDALEPIDEAVNDRRALVDTMTDPETAEALAVVIQELAAVAREIGDHVAGVPATQLGDGRLVAAVEALALGCPMGVTVSAAPGWAASPVVETVLFYACSEALANVVKHAAATRVAIDLRRLDGVVSLSVADDGIGGADPSGSGLQGLADRLAARGGRLQVDSPPGAGTTITATMTA